MSDELRVDASQIKRLRAEIKRIKPDSPEWAKKFAQVNKAAGEIIVNDARGRASTKQQTKAAAAIKPSSSQAGIRIRVAGGSGVPYALAAFWGMERRSGWYAQGKYAQSAGRQTLPWVGADWEVGGSGGPYAINPAIAGKLDEVLDSYGEAVLSLMDDLNVE